MCSFVLKTNLRLCQSLREKLWNEFEDQKIPFDDRIKILAKGSRSLWMHKSVIKKVSGTRVLQCQDTCHNRTDLNVRSNYFCQHSGFSTVPTHSLPSCEKSFIRCIYVDTEIIKCLGKLMYLGFVCVPKNCLRQFISACHHFKIGYMSNAGLELPTESPWGELQHITMVAGADDQRQFDDRANDSDDAMDIDEQPEADFGTSDVYQCTSESNINDSYSDTDIGDILKKTSCKKQQLASDMDPLRKKQQLASDMDPLRKKQQLASDMDPLRKKQQLDSDITPEVEDEVPSAKRFKNCQC